jgi:transposase InsO family protein
LQAEKAADTVKICEVFEVSRAGIYAAKKRVNTPQLICITSVALKSAFEESGQTYGSRRLQQALQQHHGIKIGRHRVRTLMRKHQLKTVWKRKFTATTDSKHNLPLFENVLNRDFSPEKPNQAWTSDITYIRTTSGWLYLAVVMDLFSRKIIGWATSSTMPAELVCNALSMAIAHRQPDKGLIVHSDRGSQYASHLYRDLLTTQGCIGSMSRKGNCWDNAPMERFFLNLKMESIWRRDYANHREAKADISHYIVNFYNSKRLHSTLGYLSPSKFELHMTTNQP